MTFLQTSSHVLGITNAHVADEIAKWKDKENIILKVGTAVLDPHRRFIAKHSDLDLATFNLSGVFLSTALQSAGTVTSWPPTPPREGDPVLMGGFPAIYREELDQGGTRFQFGWFAGKVSTVSARNIGLALDIENSISVTDKRMPSSVNLGGWSGGPVFRVVDENLLERIELTGVIYQYQESYEIAPAHPLTDLNEDGTFNG
jgi:hypothetical protein